jgi:hypothetical protein
MHGRYTEPGRRAWRDCRSKRKQCLICHSDLNTPHGKHRLQKVSPMNNDIHPSRPHSRPMMRWLAGFVLTPLAFLGLFGTWILAYTSLPIALAVAGGAGVVSSSAFLYAVPGISRTSGPDRSFIRGIIAGSAVAVPLLLLGGWLMVPGLLDRIDRFAVPFWFALLPPALYVLLEMLAATYYVLRLTRSTDEQTS